MLALLLLGYLLGCLSVVEGVDSVDYVSYDDGGYALGGYIAKPTGSGPFPAVIIVPDFDGVNQYEVKRARMIADEGYVGFAADIFGEMYREVTNATLRTQLTSYYRSNPYVFVSRIRAAVEVLLKHSSVVKSKIAMMGYCFGGTGVINYAISGSGDVLGIISFHGGLTQRLTANSSTPIQTKMVLYSGGKDDAISEIQKLEGELNAAQAQWEITRFSSILHAFTIWWDPRYNVRADRRSWDGTLLFLRELFAPNTPEVTPVQPLNDNVPPSLTEVQYYHEGASLVGYMALPPGTGQVPAVIVLPDWDGVNYYELARTRLLANFPTPYVSFGADIYGANFHNVTNNADRAALATIYRSNTTLFVGRIQAAVDAMKDQSRVDPSKIIVIGYCFGGTGVFNYAISGAKNALGVVSFHGGLTQRLHANASTPISASVLVHSGGNDDTSTSIQDLENELNTANGTWEISRYSGVVHGFTNWNGGSAYSPRADLRSWKSMMTFLSSTFTGTILPTPQPSNITLPGPSSTSIPTQTPSPSSASHSSSFFFLLPFMLIHLLYKQ